MTAFSSRATRPYATVAAAVMLAVALATPSAQTRIAAHKNSYSPAQDVQLGREAAAEVTKQLPLVQDDRVDDYVEEIGRRLAASIPAEFQHPEFRYTFDVVDIKEINAFALPGGPMFLHRGMIEAAKSEGEMAGVMAHEISHVALRHGTAQATKAQKFQIGAVAGQILGAIVGGTAGSVIAQGSQFGLGAYFLKYSREYEREADILGAQTLARAGYDPRRMADMFRTIEKEGGGRGGPEWLSSHPNPGNRYEAINREAATLQVQGSPPSNAEFQNVQARLRSMPPARTMEQVAREQQTGGRSGRGRPVGTTGVRVEPPSSTFRTYQAGDLLRISVPSNWRERPSNINITFAPEGAYFQGDNGGTAFTHGVEVGTIRNEAHDLREATEELVQSLAQSNPQLRQRTNYAQDTIGGRRGLSAMFSNVSEVTGQPEVVTISTAPLRDGTLLYVIQVAAEQDAQAYQNTFAKVRRSLQIDDARLTRR